MERKINFYSESEETIRLEGVLHLPRNLTGAIPLAVLCHPHPLGGGCMDVPLIVVMARMMEDEGMGALRFNFRGVGGSTGIFSGGVNEVEDLRGASRWLREQDEFQVEGVYMAGWSFGSWVGLRWGLSAGEVSRLALISPPTVGFDFFYFLEDISPPPDKKVLMIYGERDQFIEEAKMDDLARKLGAQSKVLLGADHFLFGREGEVAREVIDFFRQGDIVREPHNYGYLM